MATASSADITLLQFRPAYDVLAYCALSGPLLAGVSIENVRYPSVLACPQLPCLRIAYKDFISSDQIIDHLKANYSNLDAGLSSKTNAELRSFTSMLKFELALALDVARYDDDEHWWQVTYPQLVKSMSWPFNRLVARKLRHDIRQGFNRIPAHEGSRLYGWAVPACRSAYKAISESLGNGNWVLGTPGPTSVDALLFGHIAQAKFEPGLSDVLKEFSNFEPFFERVLQRVNRSKFFSIGASTFPGPDISLNVEKTIPSKALRLPPKPETQPSMDSLQPKIRKDGSLQAVIFAVTAVLAYINWSWGDMIEIRERGNDEVDDIIDEDE